MDLVPTADARGALIERAKSILLKPKTEWPVIAAEPATIGGIYSNYVVYIAAVPVLATLIGSLVFGYGFAGMTYRPSIASALTTAIVQYALQLVGVYIFALIIDWLSPRFGGEQNRVNAFKLAAYSATASWLAGIFGLIPALGVLSILGLYSVYLLYTGVPVLTRVREDKALSFTAAIIAVGIVLGIVLAALGAVFLPHPAVTPGEIGGKVSLPGGVTLDMGKLDEARKRMERAAKTIEQQQGVSPGGDKAAGEDAPAAIAPADLKALLPASLPGGYARSDISASSAGAGGFSFGQAKAVYDKGDAHITLSLMDLGGMGAFASLGGLLGINSSEETATSYSKVGQVDGRTTIEEFHSDTKSGKYVTVVQDRVMVEAAGEGASMSDLKAAVGALDLAGIEALANR
jgi:hypothetical protein